MIIADLQWTGDDGNTFLPTSDLKVGQMSSPSSVMEGCKCLQWLDDTVWLCCIWFSCCLWTSSPFFKSPKLEPLKEDTLASTYKSVSAQDGRERSWSHWAFSILYIDILNCSNQNLTDYCTALTETEVFCPVLSSLNDDKSASNWVTLQTGEILFMDMWMCSSATASLSSDQCCHVGLVPSIITVRSKNVSLESSARSLVVGG